MAGREGKCGKVARREGKWARVAGRGVSGGGW